MKITTLAETEKSKVNVDGAVNVYKQVPLSGNDGVPLFSFRVFTIEPGGHSPYHSHPFEHLAYIIEGQGVAINEEGEEKELKQGNFVLIMPDEKHQFRNTSQSGPLMFICAVPKEYE
ncbi:MAG: cupin domain-containing protein [Sedimentisphaerales bacterium]|nr:cupin domain-containing protein [Sedimentisphaerales bacterium]